MSRNRARNKPHLVKSPPGGSTALAERPPALIPLDDEIRPILAEARARRATRLANSPLKAFSLAWDENEAMGITPDMRRSGPGMLSDADRKETLYQAYLNSVWISACVDVIAKRITSGGMTIDLAENGTENQAEYDELHAFLHYINDDEDFLHLIRSIATDLLIFGECYLEIVRKNGKPYSLHKIDCATMNYMLDRHGVVVKYIQTMTHSTETVEFEPDEVIRWWLSDPKASKKALSPIERILGPVDADVHMADWVRAFFRKGARPNFWIKFPGSMDEAKRFVAWLRETYTGQANAHIPMVLYDEAELYEVGKGSVDVDFLKGREAMCKEILAAYQVPPAIVGLIESGNIGGGTGESQEKSFLHNACDPIRELIFEAFNYRVVQQGFGITNYRINTRYADYRTDDTISKVNDTAIRNGSSTVNEVRVAQGKPEVDGGDEAVIVASRDIVPVARLKQLADEQAQSAQLDIETKQATADMAATKAKQAKEPPAPVPPQLQPQNQQQPPSGAEKPPAGKANDAQQAEERHIRDLEQTVVRVNEALARADEHLRIIRAEPVRQQTTEEDHPPLAGEWTALENDIKRLLALCQVETREHERNGMVSQQGTCTCDICAGNHGKAVTEQPPYHDGCDCTLVPRGQQRELQTTNEARSDGARKRLRSWRSPSPEQQHLEQHLKAALVHLHFGKDGAVPSPEDREATAQKIASILAQARQIGQAHASEKAEEGLAWGGTFRDLLQSAWDIVTNFVGRVVDWIGGQDAEDLTEEAIEAEVENIAETVGDFEVAACIEQAILETLQAQGQDTVVWRIQPGACPRCQANHEQGPIPIGSAFESGDSAPPAHPSCRCSLALPEEDE